MKDNMISSFLDFIGTEGYILRGRTALIWCYGLDMKPKDIVLDGDIEKKIKEFSSWNGIEFREEQNGTVKTFFLKDFVIHEHTEFREVRSTVCSINGARVYDLDALLLKEHDIFDITYICNNYYDKLSDISKLYIAEKLSCSDLVSEVGGADVISGVDASMLAENILKAASTVGVTLSDAGAIERYVVSVRPYMRNGKPVKGYVRNRPRKKQ